MRNPFQRAIRVRDQFAGRNIEFVMRYKHRGSVDHVADSIRIRGWQAFEPPLPLLIAALVGQPNSRFLDIGANSGFYSLIARQLGSSEVFAYEPVDSIAEAMAVNATLTLNARRGTLNEAGLHIIRKAVGSKRGRARIYLPSQHHGLLETSASLNSSFKEKHDLIEEVDVTTIDHEYLHHGWSKELLWVVKVDVESWEEEVLLGAAQFIRDVRPVMICEILPRPSARTACFRDLCQQHGYAAFQLRAPRHLTPVDDGNFLRPSDRADWNYLFLPEQRQSSLLATFKAVGVSIARGQGNA